MPLLNSGNWNPDLHPRDSNGEFIYTDGGLHGRSPSAKANWGGGGPLKVGDAFIDLILSTTYGRIALNSPGNPSINLLDFYTDMIDKDTALRGTFPQDTLFCYSGTKYPELNGTTMSAHELNYLGFGDAMAAYGVPSSLVDPLTTLYWDGFSGNTDPITSNVYTATQAGYNAFNNNVAPH